MQNPHITPKHLTGISSCLVQTDQWPLMLTFIRLCQSLCIDIDTWMHQPHISRGKVSINVENNVIGFQDCRLYAHYCHVLCAIHAEFCREFKTHCPHFWLGAKWQARILNLLKRWVYVWPCCHPIPFALFYFFQNAQLKACHYKGAKDRDRERANLNSYTSRNDDKAIMMRQCSHLLLTIQIPADKKTLLTYTSWQIKMCENHELMFDEMFNSIN